MNQQRKISLDELIEVNRNLYTKSPAELLVMQEKLDVFLSSAFR